MTNQERKRNQEKRARQQPTEAKGKVKARQARAKLTRRVDNRVEHMTRRKNKSKVNKQPNPRVRDIQYARVHKYLTISIRCDKQNDCLEEFSMEKD
jgi:hypothetical protein